MGATDLYNVALDGRLAKVKGANPKNRLRSIVVCPGAVPTDIQPGFMVVVNPLVGLFRAWLPGFNSSMDWGVGGHLAAAVAPWHAVGDSTKKHVMWHGQLTHASSGVYDLPVADVARMDDIVST